MMGWFLAAEPGRCDGCGAHTKVNERIYYTGREAALTDEVEQRLCIECAP